MNKHIVTGNLVDNAQTRITQSGKSVTSFRVASNEYANGEKYTDFHSCVLWGARGEKMVQYLVKGQEVLVEGRHVYRTSQTQDGRTFYNSEISVREIELLRRPKADS